MTRTAWRSIEEVPYYFSMSFIEFQGHRGQKIADFDPHWAFPQYNSFEFADGFEITGKA